MVVPNESGCRQRRCLAVDRHRRIVSERRWSLSETSCAVAETANTQMLTCSLLLSDSTREPSPTCVSTVYAKNHVCGGALCRSSCEVCALEPRVRCGRDRCWILLKLYTHVQQWSHRRVHTPHHSSIYRDFTETYAETETTGGLLLSYLQPAGVGAAPQTRPKKGRPRT